MVSSHHRPVGTGAAKVDQVLRGLAQEQIKKLSTGLLYGTVIDEGSIKLDVDLDSLFAASGDFLVARGTHLAPGDRIVAMPIAGPRGTIFIFGSWSPSRNMSPVLVTQRIEFYGDTGQTTPTGAATGAVSVHKQFNPDWVLRGSPVRILGRTVRNGGTGAVTINVYDDSLGVRTLVGSQTLVPDGDFEFNLSSENFTRDDYNFVEVEAVYDDATVESATISACVMLVEEP